MTAARCVRLSALFVLCLLISSIAAWIMTTGVSLVKLLLTVVATAPLLILLPALALGRRRSYAATTLCIVPYLVIALMELLANPTARFWASAVLGLTFALFVLSIAFLRATRTADA